MRNKTIVLRDSVLLDSLSIVPGSEIIRTITGVVLNDSIFTINYSKSTIYNNNAALMNTEIDIAYRVFPIDFSKQYPAKPLIYNNTLFANVASNSSKPYFIQNTQEESSNILINGNISRGISMSNSQNLVVNSNLNLQLNGELSKGMQIEAYISDKNIPVQPDGYTQQIQDFDQVYIRVYDSIRSLQMGDVEINAQNSHFLKFSRRILGGNFSQQNMVYSENTKGSTQISAAVAKGNYQRSEIAGIEGVQGPYLLKGANNETYIMVLAGTEKVYIDGVLVNRGENADYIINYNTAEITFTPKVFITGNTRIIVEFEYSDKNYNRFLLYGQNSVSHKKNTYAVQYFTEGDAKNQPINQTLSPELKAILAQAGTDPMKAIVNNYDSVGYDAGRILYKMIDTLVNNIVYDSILVYSSNSSNAFYHAGFALVGEQKGNYIQEITTANGKVFKWLAPIDNIPQGNYEPIQLLIAPAKKQMIVANSEFRLAPNTKANIEMAYADNNPNTFADKKETISQGIALSNLIEHTIPVVNKSVLLRLNYEFKQEHFNPIERYRSSEFNRDWNLLPTQKGNEHFVQTTIALNKLKTTKLAVNSEYLNLENNYEGFRNSISANYGIKGISLKGSASFLNTQTELNNTQFYRHNLNISRNIWKIKLGALHEFEKNSNFISNTDSLLSLSKKFSLAEAFISNSDSVQSQFRLAYKNRKDYAPNENTYVEISKTDDIAFSLAPASSKNQELKGSIIWRQLNYKNELIAAQKNNENNLLAQIDHELNIKNRTLTFFTFYEIGTGLENRKEFSYIEVQQGQGIYIWIDYNNNNIPELNEFEISPFPEEANYLRIYTPTSDYIKVYTLKFNETVKLEPSRIWQASKGIKHFLSLFSNITTLIASHKHIQTNLMARINPLPGFVDDTAQMNRNVAFRNTLAFNRSHPKFGMDYTYNQQDYKILQVNGFDISNTQQHRLKIRWNMSQELSLLNVLGKVRKQYTSDYFKTKNSDIQSLENQSTLQWQPTTKFRISLMYQIKNKTNSLGYETAILQETGPEIKINSSKQGAITIKAALITNNYNGDKNLPITFSMLEGYLPGENYTWGINYAQNINKFLRITLSYFGRKPNDSEIIHTGQFNVSAVF